MEYLTWNLEKANYSVHEGCGRKLEITQKKSHRFSLMRGEKHGFPCKHPMMLALKNIKKNKMVTVENLSKHREIKIPVDLIAVTRDKMSSASVHKRTADSTGRRSFSQLRSERSPAPHSFTSSHLFYCGESEKNRVETDKCADSIIFLIVDLITV